LASLRAKRSNPESSKARTGLLRRFAPRNDSLLQAQRHPEVLAALAASLEGWVRRWLDAWLKRLFNLHLPLEMRQPMSTLTVTAKGQITLPNNLLKHLGVRPGEKVAVAKLPGGRIVVSARPTGKISDVFGLLKKKDGPSLSIEDINRIAAEGWAGKR
jgi:AbrB family looped-hinge helix DNA binding protein